MARGASSNYLRNYRRLETRQAGQRGLRTNGEQDRFQMILPLVRSRGEKIKERMLEVR